MEGIEIHNGEKSNIHLGELNGRWKADTLWAKAVEMVQQQGSLNACTDRESQSFVCFFWQSALYKIK